MSRARALSHNDYTVGWICALALEMATARAMLDSSHASLSQPSYDHNSYILGRIGGHNVVIACLPAGVYGTTSAATVGSQMLSTFSAIRFGLMVGIGGGVPSNKDNKLPVTMDIRLGDVIVSEPEPKRESSGVIQFDYGRTIRGVHFEQTGSLFEQTGCLDKPPQLLLRAVSGLKAIHLTTGSQIPKFLKDMVERYPRMKGKFESRGHESDQLFQADYDHADPSSDTCDNICDKDKLVQRDKRANPEDGPQIHYGLVASGNQVMRHGGTRDRLANEHGIICFEMEAAGLMDHFPCLVIRGVSDYADSHKNKHWQGYAAATAAAYARELLLFITPAQVEQTITAQGAMAERGY